MIIAFDLDGTLCNIEHRLHHIQKSPKDWAAFFADCAGDKPIEKIISVYRALHNHGHSIDIWSGRSDEVRAETVKWLDRYGLEYRFLRMRKAGDHRPDHQVKGEWLDQMAASGDVWPSLAFDDRNQVVDMWRSRGIICCQVAPGDF